MPTSKDPHLAILAETLRFHLNRPLHLDAEAAAFVTATYGEVDAKALGSLFSDADASEAGSEAETLLEFLLFPDAQLQRRIEPLLERLPSVEGLERRLRMRLLDPPITLTLRLMGSESDLTITLSKDLLDRFLIRLKLTKSWPPSLDEILGTCLDEDARIHARVLLRNGTAALGPAFVRFFEELLNKLPGRHRDFWPALDLTIQLAADLETTSDPFALLTRHKHRAFQMVEQQRECLHRLQTSNIEILLGQGYRVPPLSRTEAQRQMRVIDAICQAVYGRTTYFQPAEFS